MQVVARLTILGADRIAVKGWALGKRVVNMIMIALMRHCIKGKPAGTDRG